MNDREKNVNLLYSLTKKVRQGDQRSTGRLITLVESLPYLRSELEKEFKDVLGNARIIGVTGPPGAGKSSLVGSLISSMRDDGYSIGVIAVDPSSSYTGGSLLGDRIRLRKHFNDNDVFIRSMATRGKLGGVSDGVQSVVRVLEGYGCEYIFIETVGIGQSEIDIVHLADLVLLVLVPNLGDEVQALKAGVMEIADIFVLNKADGENTDRAIAQIRAMTELSAHFDNRQTREILKTVATENKGIDELKKKIIEVIESRLSDGSFVKARIKNLKTYLLDIIRKEFEHKIRQATQNLADYENRLQDVLEHKGDLFSILEEVKSKVHQ